MKGLLFWSMPIIFIQCRAAVHENAFTLGGITGFQTIQCVKDESEMIELARVQKKDFEEIFSK